MSKNISIQEGGIGKQLTADKLKTNLVGGGTCLWVPEDEMQLGTKHISENGTYQASDDGYYGYSEVTVSGVGTVTGKDPDGSGDDATATVDPETGDIVITKLPSSITVITPPTNPYGVYQDGQTITKDGMVVKAYFESGGEYGTVSNAEITLNPTTAVYDPTTDRRDKYDDGDIHAVKVTSSTTPTRPGGSWYSCTGITAEVTTPGLSFFMTRYNGHVYIASQNPFTTGIGISGSATNITSSGPIFSKRNEDGIFSEVPVSLVDPSNENIDDLTPERAGSPQTITVSWPRPSNGKVLETTFEILVAPGYGGDEGENGNAGTPPPGMLIP